MNYELIAQDIGIETEEDLKNFLLQLYRLDIGVADRVNSRMLAFMLGEKLKGKLPVLEVPPAHAVAWTLADKACGSCPGSELAEPFEGMGQKLPLCLCETKIEKWEGCLKFRENLRAAGARVDAGDETLLAELVDLQQQIRVGVDEFERATDLLIAEVNR